MHPRRRFCPRSSCRLPSKPWRSLILLVDGNHRAAGRRDYPRSSGFERVEVVFVWPHNPTAAETISPFDVFFRSSGFERVEVVFVWPHNPTAAEMISPFDVFVEPHGRAVLLFAGRTLPTSSPFPPTSTLLFGLSSRRICRGVGSQQAKRQSCRLYPIFGYV